MNKEEKSKDNIQIFESFNKKVLIPLSVLVTTMLLRTGKPSSVGRILFTFTIINFVVMAFLPYGINYNPNDVYTIRLLMGLSTLWIIWLGLSIYLIVMYLII
jgi:hypothetical protein